MITKSDTILTNIVNVGDNKKPPQKKTEKTDQKLDNGFLSANRKQGEKQSDSRISNRNKDELLLINN